MNPDRKKPAPRPGNPPRTADGLRHKIAGLRQQPERLLDEYPDLPFQEQMRLFMLAPAELRRELLQISPLARRIVAQLPVQEAYMTLKEIGPADALPLLAHMTPEQIRHWTDLDTWERGEFRPDTLLGFLEILLQCGQDRFADWVCTLDPEMLVLTLRAYGQVSKFDIFQDPVEADDLPPYESFDGYYRYHYQDDRARPHLHMILRVLHARDPERYGMILESAYQDMAAEVQEEALRFRNGRLSDLGVPGFAEAMEIYQPLADRAFHDQMDRTPPPRRTAAGSLSVVYPVRWLPPDSLLRRALRVLAGTAEADALRMELAALGNKVVVADGMEASNPRYVKAALQKVSGMITIGLEHLGARDEAAAAAWMRKSWLVFLFRLGYTRVHGLKEAALPLLDQTRFRWGGQALSLAGSPLEETLWAVTRPRPLFFDQGHPESFLGFRDFQSLEDIQACRDVLAAVQLLSRFFNRRGLSPEAIKAACLEGGWGDRADQIRWSSVLNTLRAGRLVCGEDTFRLLQPEQVGQFARRFFSEGPPGGAGRTLHPDFADGTLRWVEEEAGPATLRVEAVLSRWVRAATSRLDQELGGLDPDRPPDPRFVGSLCMRHFPAREA